jgi:hypothetical protein
MNREMTEVLPTETLAHIQSAGCKSQKKSVIDAQNRCWKYLIGAVSTHGETGRDLEFIGGDKDKQLGKLWAEKKIGDILPWDEIADEPSEGGKTGGNAQSQIFELPEDAERIR